MSSPPAAKTMRLRYAGTCRLCGARLEQGERAVYERDRRTVRCLQCAVAVPDETVAVPKSEQGRAGGSARREYERRKAKRRALVRTRHPLLGGLLLAWFDDPQSTTAWASGARGEAAVGERLDRLASDSIAVLHDRRIPGSRANIDHLVITTGGVYVVDAKRYVGQRPARRVDGGILRPRVEKLMVGGRDRTRLVDGVLAQVERVASVLGAEAAVSGVLCFVEADWPTLGGVLTVGGVRVTSPRRLSRIVTQAEGRIEVAGVQTRLSHAFPPA